MCLYVCLSQNVTISTWANRDFRWVVRKLSWECRFAWLVFWNQPSITVVHLCLLIIFFLFRATLKAYRSPQARVELELHLPAYTTATATPAEPRLWTTPQLIHSNTGSLSNWARAGTEPTSSWILVGFVSTVPQQEIPINYIFISIFLVLKDSPMKFQFPLD